MRFRVTVEAASDQPLDLDQHQWLRLVQALGPPPARVSSQHSAWTADVDVDATSQDDACAQARDRVAAAATSVGLAPSRVLRCTAGPAGGGPVTVVPLRPVQAVRPAGAGPVTVRGAMSVNGDRLGWRGPLRLVRLLFVPSESARRTFAHLDAKPAARGTTTFTVPRVNGALLYPPGPARAVAQALHPRAHDRELRRRGFTPTGADARGSIRYTRIAPMAAPDE